MSDIQLFSAPSAPAWTPSDRELERGRLRAAMKRWGFDDIGELHKAAIDDPEWFWRAVVDDLGVAFSQNFTQALDDSDGKPFPRWFVGGRINVVDGCSRRHARGPIADKEAVVYEGDEGQRRSLTFASLDEEVRRFAANLSQLGVRRGDRVVLFVPVVPEATIAFLACAWIGAISVPAFTGFGAEALATRLRDSEAVALITADATTRRGKRIPLKATADEALASAPTVKSVVVVRHLGDAVFMHPGRDVYWDELDSDPGEVPVAEMDPNDPLTIVYTSGTTGAPKGIVHSHGGLGVKAAYDFAYGFDVHEDDVIAWISDMGWLVGPLLILGGLQLGATIVLVEGVPTHPRVDRLWELASRNKVTLQGVAPTAIRAVMAADESMPGHDLSGLRAFVSTGEAWDEPTWWWLYETVGHKTRPIINYSGGTEVSGGLLTVYGWMPAEAASFNGPLPGIDVAVLGPEGERVVGEVGELAVMNTFPGMTHAFWHDRERYLETYWNRWPDVWVHGDLASISAEGSWRIHGRSDDTIKVSGRRIGPAEIEASLLQDRRIVEAAAIGVPDKARGQRIVAFLVVNGSVDEHDLAATAERNVGRSFAPSVQVVATLPKTKNGKIMRRAIRAQYLGDPVGDMSSLDPLTPLSDIPAQH